MKLEDVSCGQFVLIGPSATIATVVEAGPHKVQVRVGSLWDPWSWSSWYDPSELYPVDVEANEAVLADRANHPDPFEGL